MSEPAPTAAPPEPAPWRLDLRSLRRRWWWVALGLTAALVIAMATWGWVAWNQLGRLAPSGGLPFLRAVELPVPSFLQNDPRWGTSLLGATEGTLGAEGCAVSSAAMVLAYYGIDTDPQRLNTFLTEREGGYTPEGWIYWEKAAELAPEKVRHAYEALGSYRLLDENLLHGNPVIAKLRLRSGTTHFVVIAGKHGLDYLTQDPGAGGKKGLYPLKDLGSRIEGLRFYQRL